MVCKLYITRSSAQLPQSLLRLFNVRLKTKEIKRRQTLPIGQLYQQILADSTSLLAQRCNSDHRRLHLGLPVNPMFAPTGLGTDGF